MITKLLKVIILSRFPKSTITMIVLLDAVLVGMSVPGRGISPAISPEFSLLSILYITFLVGISPFNSRFNLVTKSDSDFLVMLPVDDRELIASFILGYFVVSLLFSAVFVAWFVYALGLSGLVIPPFLALAISSMSGTLYNLDNRKKAVVSVVMVAWFLSALARFPLSPLSMFAGFWYGYVILPVFSLVLLVLALKRFNYATFSTMSYTPPGKQEVKREITFNAGNPFLLMLERNLRIFEIGGRMNLMGSYTFVSRRIEWWKILSITAGVGIAIYVLSALGFRSFQLGFYVLLGTWIFTVSYSNSAFISEPIWLDMNVMSPIQFARYYVLSKALSVGLMLLPISLSFLALGRIGIAVAMLVDLPLSSIMIISLYARFYQINFQNPMTFSPSRYLVGFLTMIPLVGIVLIAFLPTPGVMEGVTVFEALISLPFLAMKRYWERVVEKIVTTV
ncbi:MULTISPECIES: hypothetical protein [Metallosphaera]|uniref:Uncharacterized protein n=3 Tax=Metallosphaera TaxID=41980 RepID=A4YG43_METS5|nr:MULTISPECIES: hypothetical protein [Metallosphaera]ABP95395.1 hypothetical protein Msed_1234 [Metallosphaera sedula DSM 5348]AIM27380.1 hypothetical protein HA72_1234 [Metallosphaera sedula]AKV74260.1 hypothetical protein MsedA_1254 [Metallosphaera sedula]AKV76499.1 hypothetical protein MsedB_1256 [Metallosphaera sedula]AKV78751.1 hypothetical protein MsedC_1254 [Metallosphaera sedula]